MNRSADDPLATFAFGLALRLVPTDEGGRKTSIAGGAGPESRFKYRPNWGLPGMTPPEQTGAPALGFSRTNVMPGETVMAVIVPIFPAAVSLWGEVEVGAELLMYEGPRICGTTQVQWRDRIVSPLPEDDEQRFLAWLS